MSNGDFVSIQRYHFKNFLVHIYSVLGKNGKKKFAAKINNDKWQTSVYSSGNTPEGSRKLPRSIVLYDESEENLRNRVSSLLKEPDLEKDLTGDMLLAIASSRWNGLGIEVNSLVPPGADFESVYGEEPYDDSPYDDNNPLDDYDYDSVDDTHSMEWNEVEEEWSNEEDYS